jgi:hypothetical protein
VGLVLVLGVAGGFQLEGGVLDVEAVGQAVLELVEYLGGVVRGRGLQADAAVHLPVRDPARRAAPQQLLGWSWADPIAALVIAAVAVKEGRDAWRGRHCC